MLAQPEHGPLMLVHPASRLSQQISLALRLKDGFLAFLTHSGLLRIIGNPPRTLQRMRLDMSDGSEDLRPMVLHTVDTASGQVQSAVTQYGWKGGISSCCHAGSSRLLGVLGQTKVAVLDDKSMQEPYRFTLSPRSAHRQPSDGVLLNALSWDHDRSLIAAHVNITRLLPYMSPAAVQLGLQTCATCGAEVQIYDAETSSCLPLLEPDNRKASAVWSSSANYLLVTSINGPDLADKEAMSVNPDAQGSPPGGPSAQIHMCLPAMAAL